MAEREHADRDDAKAAFGWRARGERDGEMVQKGGTGTRTVVSCAI